MDEHALQSLAEAVHSARPPYLVTLAACNYAISHPDTVDRLLLSYLSHRDPWFALSYRCSFAHSVQRWQWRDFNTQPALATGDDPLPRTYESRTHLRQHGPSHELQLDVTIFELGAVPSAATGVITLSRRLIALLAAFRSKAFRPRPSAVANVDADDSLALTYSCPAKLGHGKG